MTPEEYFILFSPHHLYMHNKPNRYLAFTKTYPTQARELVTTIWVAYEYMRSITNKITQFNAIRDTGATESMVTPKVVQTLKMPAVTRNKVKGVNSETLCNVYAIDLLLPNKFMIQNIHVTEASFPWGDFLIGMDIISLWDFAVTRKNQSTVMSFVMPNLRMIDFEKEVKETEI